MPDGAGRICAVPSALSAIGLGLRFAEFMGWRVAPLAYPPYGTSPLLAWSRIIERHLVRYHQLKVLFFDTQ